MSCACTRALRSIASTPAPASGSLLSMRRLSELRPPDDRVERRPQLVRQRGQEFVLQAVGALGLGARGPLAAEQPLALGLDRRALGDVGAQRQAHVGHRSEPRRSTRAPTSRPSRRTIAKMPRQAPVSASSPIRLDQRSNPGGRHEGGERVPERHSRSRPKLRHAAGLASSKFICSSSSTMPSSACSNTALNLASLARIASSARRVREKCLDRARSAPAARPGA